jgi:hypothetical protein
MAISKISGTAWADISKVDGVNAANIAALSGINAPAPTTGIVTDNLFLHYDAEFVSGSSVLDQSGNGYNMTMYNGAYVGTYQGVTAFHTDGVNDLIYGQIPQADMASIDYPITMEAWHYYNAGSGMFSAFVINHAADTVDWLRNVLISTGARAFGQVYTWSGQRYTQVDKTNAFATSGWKHITLTIERTPSGGRHNLRIYVNGAFALENSVPQVTQYDDPAYTIVPWSEGSGVINASIGCLVRSTPSYYYARTSEARFYADKLTDAEILQNYNAKKTKHGI